MNPILYKITDQGRQTYGSFQWPAPHPRGKWLRTRGEGKLCGAGWLHAYTSPRLAVLLNPIHANIASFRLWELEWRGKRLDDHGLKVGVSEARLVRELEPPVYSTTQRVTFAILCAREVHTDPARLVWADNWLSGRDRSAVWAWPTAWAWAAEEAAKAARAAIDLDALALAALEVS